jgi:hypothetical protein
MKRLLPWYVTEGRLQILGWLVATVGNAITLAAYTAGLTAGALLVWRVLS